MKSVSLRFLALVVGLGHFVSGASTRAAEVRGQSRRIPSPFSAMSGESRTSTASRTSTPSLGWDMPRRKTISGNSKTRASRPLAAMPRWRANPSSPATSSTGALKSSGARKKTSPRLTPELQAMTVAYVDGINRYLATHPETKPRLLTHFEPWYVLAMDRHMILHFIYGAAHVKRPGNRQPGEIARSIKPAPPTGRSIASWDVPAPTCRRSRADVQAAIGSNAFAISGKKTASGSAMLFINPHQPWYGMGQFYESHIRSDQGLNFTGACFIGTSFPTIGHNENLGWAYTVNDPDIADGWRVTFDDKAHPLNYRYDGGYRKAVEWSETIKVKKGEALVGASGHLPQDPSRSDH